MNLIFWIAFSVLLGLIALLSFLLLGLMRSVAVQDWRLTALEKTTPSRLGRNGLRVGKRAPDFSLPGVDGEELSLNKFVGQKVFLVFLQGGCSPCEKVIPEFNRLNRNGGIQVIGLFKGDEKSSLEWKQKVGAEFPTLVHDGLTISKKYEVFATPFAFLIDEKGIVLSKGIVSEKKHIDFVIEGRGKDQTKEEAASQITFDQAAS